MEKQLTPGQVRYALNICGCVDDDVLDLFVSIVRKIEQGSGGEAYASLVEQHGDTVAHALLVALDLAGLIEHGSSIRGSWIREEAYSLPENPGPIDLEVR